MNEKKPFFDTYYNKLYEAKNLRYLLGQNTEKGYFRGQVCEHFQMLVSFSNVLENCR